MKNIIYPPEAAAILDVTKAPYFADNTGKTDCTQILVSILDDIARHSLEGMKWTVNRLQSDPRPTFRLENSFENRKQDGVIFGIFPDRLPPSRIIYFPKGTYLISDTICYSLDNLQNFMGSEINWCIRFQGENRAESIIRLKDCCKGFERGMARPVISFIRNDEGSNIAMSNYFRDLTIDTGAGNPGAVGLEFFGNNSAAVRNVTIRSGDPEGRGAAGLSVSRKRATGCLFQNVEIEGFDYGIRFNADDTYLVCDHIHLKNQRIRGMSLNGPVVSIRSLTSRNLNPAVTINGNSSHVVLLDADLSGGAPDAPAIEFLDGQLFARDIRTGGYLCAAGRIYTAGWGAEPLVKETAIDEYTSHTPVTLSKGQLPRSLNLPIEEAPVPEWETDFTRWTHPGLYGAAGDGITDDTDAVQQAMNSGKSVIYFQPGRYLINRPVKVPAHVRRINFMFADLAAGKTLREMKNRGMFTVAGESGEPLLIEDLFSFEMNYGDHYLVEHASPRTVILRDIHSQSCAAYINTGGGGNVFIENVISTTGIFDDTWQQPCFVFKNQKAWCRQINPEYTPDKIINDGGQLVVMGFKTEGEGIAVTTRNGGQTEILGGILYFGANNEVPAVLNDESDVSVTASTTGTTSSHLFKIAVKEILHGEVREAGHALFPIRYRNQYSIPLYAGRRKKKS